MTIEEMDWAVVDTETTGLDPAKDKIVEFAAVPASPARLWETQFLVNPGAPIPCEASAIHHLTDEDVKDARSWEQAMQDLKQFFKWGILVAHNALFDASFLPCFKNKKWLCTERLARHLLPDAPRHTNQCLRYYLGGAKLDLRGQAPHRALADAIVTSFVFVKLVDIYLEKGFEDTPEALLAFAASPVKVKTMPFGKHKGTPMQDVPRDYIKWTLGNMQDLSHDLRLQFQSLV